MPERMALGRITAKLNETLAGNRTITALEVQQYNAFAFDPGGAGRNVVLPAVASSAGLVLYIANTADAPEILTVQNAGAATIVTPTQAEAAIVWCDGVSWFGLVGASS